MPISRNAPAIEEIAPAHPRSPPRLATLALFFSRWRSAFPLGVLSAVRRNTPLDYFLRVLQPQRGCRWPSFWLGLLVLLLFVQVFGWISDLQQAGGQFSGRKSDY